MMMLTQAAWLCLASLLFKSSMAIKDISSMRGVTEVTADGKTAAMTMMRKEEDNKGKSKKSLGNGLLLQETKSGDGTHFPKVGDTLQVHYTLKLNGQKIDSTRDGWNDPLVVSLGSGSVVPGWDMAFPKMSLGQRGILHVPASLAYGQEGVGTIIPPNSDLEYDVELLGINQLRVHSDSEELEATGPDMRGDARPNISLDDNSRSSGSSSTSKSASGSEATTTTELLALGSESTNDTIALSMNNNNNASADDIFATAEDALGNLDAPNSSDSIAVDLAATSDNATDDINMTGGKEAAGAHDNSTIALATVTTGVDANASAEPLAMASQSVGSGSVGNATQDAPAPGAAGLANITDILASAASNSNSNESNSSFSGPAALNMVNITKALEQALALVTSLNANLGGGSGGQDSESFKVSDLDKLVADSNSSEGSNASDTLLAGANSSDDNNGFDDSLERIASTILASAARIRSALRLHANASKASELLSGKDTSEAAAASNMSGARVADGSATRPPVGTTQSPPPTAPTE